MIEAPNDSAPQAKREFSNIEIARLIGNVILRTAQKIGLNGHGSTSLEELCTEIVLISPLDGRLDAFEYGMAWWLLQPPGTRLPF